MKLFWFTLGFATCFAWVYHEIYGGVRYRRMLYFMTSRGDWQREGYSVEEYDTLAREFEG